MQNGRGVMSKRQGLQLPTFLDALVAEGLLESEKAQMLKSVVQARDLAEKSPLLILAERSWSIANQPDKRLSLDYLTAWLAAKHQLPVYRVDPLKIDVSAITSVMSYAYAARFQIIAVEVRPDEVVIATADPQVREWQTELASILKKKITPVVTSPDDIGRYLLEFYTLSRSVKGASDDASNNVGAAIQNLEQLMELGRRGGLDANDQHVVNIVDWLLQYAFDQRASDIHLEPRREQGNVRFRIDGVLHLVYEIPPPVMSAVTSRIKILGRMDVAERRKPQDGRLKTRTPDGNEVELRLSTMPTVHGEKLVMRVFDPDVLMKDYAALGLGASDIILWEDLICRPHGIILVTGPTGSGKTTTLYSTLKQLARPEVNLCSVEDPVELIEPSFNQMQVQNNIGLDFAAGVRTLMRQDPDIIMIGEIRDLETAEMAIQAALTGHLVFSTLHTNDAPSAITRLLDIGVPHYLINATLLGVVAQRLVRTLCPHCREKAEADAPLWKALVNPWKIDVPKQVYTAKGCLECRQTGFRGRIGIYEMLPLSMELKAHIGKQNDVGELRRSAIKAGMKPLRINGAQKVVSGLTTIEEIMQVAPLHE